MTGEADADVGRATAGVLGLPDAVAAGLFDLDGGLTNTAAVHDKAWQEMCDAFLRERAERTGESFVAFDPVADYVMYVEGKPAPDSFLAGARCVGAAVFQEALAGVARGRGGGFGFVVGVDRTGEADALLEHGADMVVSDLAELLDPAGGKPAL